MKRPPNAKRHGTNAVYRKLSDESFQRLTITGDGHVRRRIDRGDRQLIRIGGDSFDSEGLWRQRPDVDEVYFTTHAYLGEDNKNPRVIAFRKEYVEAFPDAAPVAFAALGYDAARLLMAAIKQANSAEPEDIRRTLAGIRRFEGVTGTMSYPQGSRIPMKSVSLIGVSGGTLRLVREILPKSAPAP